MRASIPNQTTKQIQQSKTAISRRWKPIPCAPVSQLSATHFHARVDDCARVAEAHRHAVTSSAVNIYGSAYRLPFIAQMSVTRTVTEPQQETVQHPLASAPTINTGSHINVTYGPVHAVSCSA